VNDKFNFNGYSVDFEGSDAIAVMDKGNEEKNQNQKNKGKK